VTTAKTVVQMLALALVTVLALTGCASVSRGIDSSPDPRLRGQWRLTSFRDSAGSIDLARKVITLTIADTDHTGGRSSCNPYRAWITGTSGVIYLRIIGHETATCSSMEALATETRYIAALDRVTRASARGDALTLSGDSITLGFTRAAPPKLAGIAEGAWILDGVRAIGTEKLLRGIDTKPAELQFSGKAFVGTTGCGTFGGRYRPDAGELAVSAFALDSSTGTCSQSNLAQESLVTRVLATAFTVEVGDRMLVVRNYRTGIELVYARLSKRDRDG
jgi:heat shock protein HslJ